MIILTGPVHSGKTSLLKSLVDAVSEAGIKISGYLSLSIWEKGENLGYNLLNIKTQIAQPFLRRQGEEHWEKIGRFFFVPSGLAEAKRILSLRRPHTWLFVDELGPFELSGKGIWPIFNKSLVRNPQKTICVIREEILESFLPKLTFTDPEVFVVESPAVYSHLYGCISSLD